MDSTIEMKLEDHGAGLFTMTVGKAHASTRGGTHAAYRMARVMMGKAFLEAEARGTSTWPFTGAYSSAEDARRHAEAWREMAQRLEDLLNAERAANQERGPLTGPAQGLRFCDEELLR